MSKRRIFWFLFVGVLVLIQLYPAPRPEVSSINPGDLMKNVDVPSNISTILKSTCYDCHSNETIYPWYSNIAPVKWLVYYDINNAREELNFSEWNSLTKMDKAEILDDISTEVLEEEMPLKIYPLLHAEAKLSKADRESISEWAEMLAEELFE